MNYKKFSFAVFLLVYLLSNIFISSLFGQDRGTLKGNKITENELKKTAFDDESKKSYNNFRSDSTEVIFYMVKIDKDLMYKKPKKNSEVIYSLKSFTFVEFIKKSKSRKYYKVRIYDTSYDYIEGWVRSKTLKKEKYFGMSLKANAKDEKNKEQLLEVVKENEISPYWVKGNNLKLFANDNLTGAVLRELNIGDQVFVNDVDIKTGIAGAGFMLLLLKSALAPELF